MSDTTPSSSPIRTTTLAGYLQYLLELAVQQFGANAPVTQDIRRQLDEVLKRQGKPVKEQRYHAGFRGR